ncbi:uncharacterized protein LOC111909876 [Lactuca sativa]|uniref:RING-type E3 ubiquitin transferase n=1 Tax=Lactuca sativa TaxID=4236 RepID=A0A9R1W7Y8_LACSA|nr:uncharacterized protein LOC111909876 [Lactuca sativa]KAJ0218853.1 hypothetical protein LSAT_V11C300137070 [Lactuca sativa]
MAHISKTQFLHQQSDESEHHILQEDEGISSEQTLDNTMTNCFTLVEDDDLVNVEEEEEEDVPYTFNFDPFSPLNSSFFVPSSSSSFCYHHQHHHNHQVKSNSNSCSCCSSESESESSSEFPDSTVYPDCLYGDDEEYDQMDFITDLFDSRGDTELVSRRFSSTDVGISVSEGSPIDDDNDDFVSSNIDHLGFEGGGLRVVGIESDSDTEELGQVNDRFQPSEPNLERFWDCSSIEREEAEATSRVDERDGLSSVIDRIEEISVSSEISSEGDAAVGVLEWEILLAVNNLERDLEFETEGGEGFVYTAEFDTLIGQFVETVRALRGSPPASKSIVDNLPLVTLKTNKDSKQEDDNVICAVCKDEISIEEKVTELPCRHHYHGDCILPWLNIRNTCPVCRFELPTDDVEYERSKNRLDVVVDDDDDVELRVGYGFQLSP